MVFQFYFKKMDSSEFLKNLSEKKFTEVIERFFGQTGLVRVTFQSDKNEQKIHCHLHGWNGTILHASGASDNMYATIDLVAQRLEAQLARQKVKSRRRSRLSSQRPLMRLLVDPPRRDRSQDELWTDLWDGTGTPDYRVMN